MTDSPPVVDATDLTEMHGSGSADFSGEGESFEYLVSLDAYHGPLDLLLYLIRKHEVDLWNIPVAVIADQYLEYVQALGLVNIDEAGEFLVLAARLVELKSIELLPHAHGPDDVDEADPRFELVQQLIEYKRFRDLGETLWRRGQAQEHRHGVPGGRIPDVATDDVFLDDVEVWDLFRAFAEIAKETRLDLATITYDDRPIAAHMDELRSRLPIDEPVEFRAILNAEIDDLGELIGLFLALLELVRLKHVVVSQDDVGAITITARSPEEAQRLFDAERLDRSAAPDDGPADANDDQEDAAEDVAGTPSRN